MNDDIDQKIHAALQRDPHGDLPSGEPNLAEEVISTFRGRHRWLTMLFGSLNIVTFAAVVWAITRFLGATEVSAQLRWGGLTGILLLMMTMFKLWFWLEMQSNRVLREVKRVELLLLTRKEG